MEENRLFELLGKKLSGEAQPEELAELQLLLEQFPEALYTAEMMQLYWQAPGEAADRLQRESALERHMQRVKAAPAGVAAEEAPRRRSFGRMFLWSGGAAAAVLLACFLVVPTMKQREAGNTTVKSGIHRQKVELPDGSTVWLNTHTTMSYRQSADNVRHVDLEGEAFFTVKHDAAHPFVVHTADMDIDDLGTSFNVKAYAEDRVTEATLVEGSIAVRVKRQAQATVLRRPLQKLIAYADMPGQDKAPEKITVLHDSASRGRGADTLLAETAWIQNRLIFRGNRFDELALKMERWYDVRIRFADSVPAKFRFTGAFANESLDKALRELQLMKSFSYTITGKMVTIQK